MPYILGAFAMNDEFKTNCSLNNYVTKSNVNVTPLEDDFFNKIYTFDHVTYDIYNYYV